MAQRTGKADCWEATSGGTDPTGQAGTREEVDKKFNAAFNSPTYDKVPRAKRLRVAAGRLNKYTNCSPYATHMEKMLLFAEYWSRER